MADKYVNETGVAIIRDWVLSKISGSGQDNVIESISVNGTNVPPDANKNVALTVPTKVSDITNDSDFQTGQQVDAKVEAAIVGALQPKGSVAFASLPALTQANVNTFYNVTDAFTTTADFAEGAGKDYPAGTNVAIINNGTEQNPVYKYDAMTGLVDLTGLWANTSGKSNSLIAMTVSEINNILNA